ncbi:MAG TPA: hypothetical protein VK988_07690 [Acidimicrobiales bacterium]|nr:hypothetical protein [Acidimicrobiales bacterium]
MATPKHISEHAFDKLRLLDCTFGEFHIARQQAEVIEETIVQAGSLKELLLVVEWKRPLHGRPGRRPSPRGTHGIGRANRPAALRAHRITCGGVELGNGAHVRCNGNGRKQRCVPLTAANVAILRVWRQERGGLRGDPMFPTRKRRRLSDDAVAARVAIYKDIAAECCSADRRHGPENQGQPA